LGRREGFFGLDATNISRRRRWGGTGGAGPAELQIGNFKFEKRGTMTNDECLKPKE
jgi:hypothetical protein